MQTSFYPLTLEPVTPPARCDLPAPRPVRSQHKSMEAQQPPPPSPLSPTGGGDVLPLPPSPEVQRSFIKQILQSDAFRHSVPDNPFGIFITAMCYASIIYDINN